MLTRVASVARRTIAAPAVHLRQGSRAASSSSPWRVPSACARRFTRTPISGAHRRVPCSGSRRHVAVSAASSSASPDAVGADADPAETVGVLRRRVDALAVEVNAALEVCDADALKARLSDLDNRASEGALWDNPAAAKKVMAELADVKAQLSTAEAFSVTLEDARMGLEMVGELDTTRSIERGETSGDESAADERAYFLQEASAACVALRSLLDAWETRRLLAGPFDARGAVVYVYAGAGGTDAQDWAEMLCRMYVNWAGKKDGFSVTMTEKSAGEEAGIKSATLEIGGSFAYGFLKAEKGTHRLVRQSPFKKDATRQTSFAAIDVVPNLYGDDGDGNDAFDDAFGGDAAFSRDCEITTTRSGGSGGQNVNKGRNRGAGETRADEYFRAVRRGAHAVREQGEGHRAASREAGGGGGGAARGDVRGDPGRRRARRVGPTDPQLRFAPVQAREGRAYGGGDRGRRRRALRERAGRVHERVPAVRGDAEKGSRGGGAARNVK
jgi:peptide chain release factor 2